MGAEDPEQARALATLRDQVGTLRRDMVAASYFRFVGRPVRVRFPAGANVSTEVLHQVGDVPDGVQVLDFETGSGVVRRVAGVQWTKTLAYLQCDTANVVAVVGFFKYREDPLDVTM